MSIEKSYDSWAEQYDTNHNKTRDLDTKATIDTLSKYQFKNVLELGCGTGKNTVWLETKAEKIIGFDFSAKMLEKAKEKITSKKVIFNKTDITKPWIIENHSMDLITVNLTLEHIEDLSHIFNQANKTLIKNGILFISELHPFKQYLGSKAKYNIGHEVKELQTYIHHISDYIDNALENGLTLFDIKEWFDDESNKNIPRLISFIFKKK